MREDGIHLDEIPFLSFAGVIGILLHRAAVFRIGGISRLSIQRFSVAGHLGPYVEGAVRIPQDFKLLRITPVGGMQLYNRVVRRRGIFYVQPHPRIDRRA